ncbi:MAG: cyclase family protein [Simkaniaceae bacterium]
MLSQFELIDLSVPLHESMPTWTGIQGFSKETTLTYKEGGAWAMEYKFVSNAGTHMDAPSHFSEGHKNIMDLPLENFAVSAAVINLADKMSENLQFTLQDFEMYEKTHGKIPEKSIVLGCSGWSSKYWESQAKYRNADKFDNKRFPIFHDEVVDLLLERNIVGIGIDTFSPDLPDAHNVHHKLLSAGKYIIENLTNLEKLPPKGAYIFCAPIKMKDVPESPVRAVAFVPKKR